MSNQEVCHQCGEGFVFHHSSAKFMRVPVCLSCADVLEHVYSRFTVTMFTEEEARQIRLCAEEKYQKYIESIKPQEQSITTREWAEKVFGIPKR